MKTSDFVSATSIVSFNYYRQGFFYYDAINKDGESYTFPVPESDIGTATLLAEDKSVFFMRWISKAIETGQMAKNVNVQ